MSNLRSRDDIIRAIENHIDDIDSELSKGIHSEITAELLKAKSKALEAAVMLENGKS